MRVLLGDTAAGPGALEVGPGRRGGAPRLVEDDGLQAALDLRLDLDDGARLAADPRRHAVARAGVPRLDLAEHVGGADEVLPAREHLAAQQCSVLRCGVDSVDRGLIVGVDGGFGTVEPVELLLPGIRDAGHAPVEVGDRAAQRARGDAGSGCSVSRNPF